MNHKFVDIFGHMETEEQEEIMGRYTAHGYLEAEEIIWEKAEDMVEHYITTVFQNDFKAQVVGVSKEAAHRYKVAMESMRALSWLECLIMKQVIFMWKNTKNTMLKFFCNF